MAPVKLPDAEILRKLFSYDPDTGILTHKERTIELCADERIMKSFNSRLAGKAITYAGVNGYIRTQVLGRSHVIHRIIWKMQTGEDAMNIDHINHNRADNRFKNLRNVTHIENHKNMGIRKDNKSGVPGIFWDRRAGRWKVAIAHLNRTINGRACKTLDEALAELTRVRSGKGFHPNHGLKNPPAN